jgi:hypothetical protein
MDEIELASGLHSGAVPRGRVKRALLTVRRLLLAQGFKRCSDHRGATNFSRARVVGAQARAVLTPVKMPHTCCLRAKVRMKIGVFSPGPPSAKADQMKMVNTMVVGRQAIYPFPTVQAVCGATQRPSRTSPRRALEERRIK